jgi:hypothetical protein
MVLIVVNLHLFAFERIQFSILFCRITLQCAGGDLELSKSHYFIA